jgi:16S rRNA U516 pseudouridylate synthase RsuA-like enzyme
MATVILFNKPYGVLCQLTSAAGCPCLKDYVPVPGVYPAGRLDFDNEGLLVLTGDGALQARISQPRRMTAKIGHPTLRLIRGAVGPWTLEGLAPGQWREAPVP